MGQNQNQDNKRKDMPSTSPSQDAPEKKSQQAQRDQQQGQRSEQGKQDRQNQSSRH